MTDAPEEPKPSFWANARADKTFLPITITVGLCVASWTASWGLWEWKDSGQREVVGMIGALKEQVVSHQAQMVEFRHETSNRLARIEWDTSQLRARVDGASYVTRDEFMEIWGIFRAKNPALDVPEPRFGRR